MAEKFRADVSILKVNKTLASLSEMANLTKHYDFIKLVRERPFLLSEHDKPRFILHKMNCATAIIT